MTSSDIERRTQLSELNMAVARAVGTHPQCITAVAILVELGRLKGFDLVPRAVSVSGRSGATFLATGGAAKASLIRQGVPVESMATQKAMVSDGFVDSPFLNSGHMVAIDETSRTLLDPSFSQFSRAGFPMAGITAKFGDGAKTLEMPLSEDSFVVYHLDADTGGWRDQYEFAQAHIGSMPSEISDHLSAGGDPLTHSVCLGLDGSILV
ncbi:hypothetical protein [Leucobacter sp. cx-169]|uniref:hypothetical protein n=1 Tax=Leucobacter sp. cx-169 TaxID=2770549 RepID=UPI00165D69B4|nr:hypothetical protein [Leucobacter sp. cx-169]MBC9927236.1 hypothetical protein [Leucobacter sp. cx-169]